MVRHCVWSRNFVNEETLDHWGLSRQNWAKHTNKLITLEMRSALFWDFMQSRLVVCYRRFETTCSSYFQGRNKMDHTITFTFNQSNKSPYFCDPFMFTDTLLPCLPSTRRLTTLSSPFYLSLIVQLLTLAVQTCTWLTSLFRPIGRILNRLTDQTSTLQFYR